MAGVVLPTGGSYTNSGTITGTNYGIYSPIDPASITNTNTSGTMVIQKPRDRNILAMAVFLCWIERSTFHARTNYRRIQQNLRGEFCRFYSSQKIVIVYM